MTQAIVSAKTRRLSREDRIDLALLGIALGSIAGIVLIRWLA